jgi:two-component system CheB/CheR fusion protein
MKICYIIRLCSGIDFSHYKEEMVERRVKIRMNFLDISTVEKYLNRLNNDINERVKLFDSLTVGSKSFFKDQDICEVIREEVFPRMNYSKDYIRIWSIGCATGEEVYSLAINFLEYSEKNNKNIKLKIFATDIDTNALNYAREGLYRKEEIEGINEKLVKKYFEALDSGYRVSKSIREMIVFAKHDLLKDPPFSKVDLINCRSVLKSYNKESQYHILYSFHYALNTKGFLLIGKKESLGIMSKSFIPINEDSRIYQFKDSRLTNKHRSLTSNKSHSLKTHEMDKVTLEKINTSVKEHELMHKILEKYVSSGVLIDSQYNILQVFNDVHPYLKVSKKEFSNSIFANISSNLALILTDNLKQLESKTFDVISSEIINLQGYDNFLLKITQFDLRNNKYFFISFEVLEKESDFCKRTVIDFSQSDFQNIFKERIIFLEKEQLAFEKKSSKEKEQLKSEVKQLKETNHKLMISMGKLQSLNEELYSVNDEYERGMKEQFDAIKDLKVLINSLPIEAIYLNHDLEIVSMTNGIYEYTHLLEKDIGRNIKHLVINQKYDTLIEDIQRVQETSKTIDRLIGEDSNQLIFRIKEYIFNNEKAIIIIVINTQELLIDLNKEGSFYEG